METGTLAGSKQQETQPAVARDGSQKEPAAQDAAKAKDGKMNPAPERKKITKLSEDKRFKLFSGTANPRLAEAIGKHI